tara:strand:+ start:1076 stop:1576 length:501 start_codon:yes stop_codon:yes gene_type:complete
MKKNINTIVEAVSKNWFKALLITSLIIVSFSCSTLKTKTKKTTDTNTLRDIKETETVKSTRKGDTLSYTVLNPILKDTIIYVRNEKKIGSNTLRIRYDQSGKQTIDCISDEINELKETIRSISENENKKEELRSKVKESFFKPIFFLYLFLGLAFLMLINKILKRL